MGDGDDDTDERRVGMRVDEVMHDRQYGCAACKVHDDDDDVMTRMAGDDDRPTARIGDP